MDSTATTTDRFRNIRREAKMITPGATLFYKGSYRRVVKNIAKKGGKRDLILTGMDWPVRVPSSKMIPVFFGC